MPIEAHLRAVNPRDALAQIALAIPDEYRKNLIIIGSLAVGYRYFAGQEAIAVRTKDVDCLLSPRVQAIPAGVAIAERLLDQHWQIGHEGKWMDPGNADTPTDELPAVRLSPPGDSKWFVELLTVPESAGDRSRKWVRLETRHGHFGLPSFGYLALANLDPIDTDLGIQIARPEMMTLANLLEHTLIGPERMSGGFHERDDIKRSNKDLGRVVAIARLAMRENEDALLTWPERWQRALSTRFGNEWRELANRTGNGLREMLASEPDLEQAWYTCYYGVLNALAPTMEQIRLAGDRLLVDAIAPLERRASAT